MGDEPIHEQCTAHSGTTERLTLVIWLLGILITLNVGWGVTLYNSISEVRTTTERYLGRLERVERDVMLMQQRIDRLHP